MTIKEFFESKDKLAIHCNTEEKAKKLLGAFDKAGHRWVTGDCYIADTAWGIYEEETCYNNTGCYGSTNYFKECHYTIFEFEEIELEDASLKSCLETMDDLISRQAAIEWLEAIEEKYIHSGDESFDNKRRQAIHLAIEVLKQPERKKGKWINETYYDSIGHEYHTWVCSQCNILNSENTPYCPHCGVEMEEEQ